MATEKEIEVLVDLGLTSCQARVYLALCHYGELNARAISIRASVPRQDVYRIIDGLESLGLVEKNISRPLTLKALSIGKGTEILLMRRKTETQRLVSNVISIVSDFEEIQKRPLKTEFVLIPKKEAVVEKIRSAIDGAKKSVDLVLSWGRFRRGSHDFAKSLQKAADRKVKFRFILEMPPKEEKMLIIELVRNNPYCEAKFLQTFPKSVMGIYDERELFVIIDPKAGLPDSPALWSTSTSLLAALKDYFEILWMISPAEPN